MNHDDVPQFDHLMSPPSDEFSCLFWPISSSGDMPPGTERQPSKLAIFTLAQLGIINPVLTQGMLEVEQSARVGSETGRDRCQIFLAS